MIDPQFLWCDGTGVGRNRLVIFRRTFHLETSPREARMHLFADSAYQLYVNGQLLGMGPVRFDPRHPCYDTYDLRPHLRPGRNAVAVLVKAFGVKTYKAIAGPGGFLAWGEVEDSSGRLLPLTSLPGLWKTRPHLAYRTDAPKLSFALDCIDLFDQAAEEPGWSEAGFDDSTWPQACPLDHPAWGPLQSRPIPLLDLRPLPPPAKPLLLPLAPTFAIESCPLSLPGFFSDQKTEDDPVTFGFCTRLHSPRNQSVTIGLFWGEFFLNGVALGSADRREHTHGELRYHVRVSLREGWNLLNGKVNGYWDQFPLLLAHPPAAGLTVSAGGGQGEGANFWHTRALRPSELARLEESCGGLAQAFAPDQPRLAEFGGWQSSPSGNRADCPCWQTAWDEYEPVFADPDCPLPGTIFRCADYPRGFAVLLDLEHIHLLLPRLRLSGVAGATVDVTYSEHLAEDTRYLLHRHNYIGGDRLHLVRDELDWRPSQPRGARYLKVTVRGARGDVRWEGLDLVAVTYPGECRGNFTCSDPLLNRVWELCARTQGVNREDAYVDCVGRERGMYARDTIIQYYNNLAVFGDHALMGRCLQLYGQSPTPEGKFRAVYPNSGNYTIADFALELVTAYEGYHRESGDIERLRQDWPAILRNLAWFDALSDERPDGLLDADWAKRRQVSSPYGGFHGDNANLPGYSSRAGVNCHFTCHYIVALQSAVAMAHTLGDRAAQLRLSRRLRRVRRSARTAFWDERTGGYADRLGGPERSAQATALAVLANLPSRTQRAAVRNHLRTELETLFNNGYDPAEGAKMSPAYAYFVFQALYAVDLPEVAESLFRQGWGWMLQAGQPTCPEFFSLEASRCHAWSASPVYFLSRHALGVRFPQAPNLDVVEIDIQAGANLTWAQGTWPHPRGDLVVRWERQGSRYLVTFNAPPEVEVRAAHPGVILANPATEVRGARALSG